MAELKPCPFCGGEPYLAEHDTDYGKHYSITCDHCLARVDCVDKEAVINKWEIRAEGRHAHWKYMGEDKDGVSIYACTNCNNEMGVTSGHKPSENIKYCPRCGAQIDGEV